MSWKLLLLEEMEANGDDWKHLQFCTVPESVLLTPFKKRPVVLTQSDSYSFTLWTEDYVYFSDFNGEDQVLSVARNPNNHPSFNGPRTSPP